MTIIQVEERRLIRECGSVHEITDWLDKAGDDCAAADAAWALALDHDGGYLVIDLTSFDAVSMQ